MKKILNIISLISFSLAGCYTPGRVSVADNNNYSGNYSNTEVSYETFYNELQPYGNWVNNPDYGYVWRPNADQRFRPYETDGHWISTTDGWAWASDYSWGWAPFHYGRWFYDQSVGWGWVPGNQWAPAWVTWGQYNDSYAWAPLAPSINISVGNTWRAPATYWSFAPRNCISYSNLDRYTVRGNNATNINNITIINNYNSYNQKEYYDRGPDYREVQRFTRKSVVPVGIASINRPGSSRVVNQRLQVYRPSINNAGSNIKALNNAGIYDESRREDSRNQTGINTDINRNRRKTNVSNSPVLNNRNAIANDEIIRNNSTQRDIDNTNRQLQQQQIERFRRLSPRAPASNGQVISGDRINTQALPQNNLPRQDIRNIPPAGNRLPSRPQQRFQDSRIMQAPSALPQGERIIRQPAATPLPPRIPNRETAPIRNIQTERRINPIQRP